MRVFLLVLFFQLSRLSGVVLIGLNFRVWVAHTPTHSLVASPNGKAIFMAARFIEALRALLSPHAKYDIPALRVDPNLDVDKIPGVLRSATIYFPTPQVY